MEMAHSLGIVPTVITHEESDIFSGSDVFTFSLDQRDEMYDLMSRCKVAYVPSKNECPGLAILECLQFMPVIVDGSYAWTRYLEDTGALILSPEKIMDTIKNLIANPRYDRSTFERWCVASQDAWLDI
jgi:hypothetical protein